MQGAPPPNAAEVERKKAVREGRGKGKKKKEQLPVADKDEVETVKTKAQSYDRAIRNSSITTTGKSIDTLVGPIEEWDCCPENLPHHPTLAFFGKRRTGKSTTMTNILEKCCQDIPFGLVLSDTAYAG